jgi:phosphoribosylformimino-5-aminoimidazole carboxamide ribonucleotide (ProFAR) isomerase
MLCGIFLRNVGGRGIRFDEVKRIIKGLPNFNFHYAGGVKNFRDLKLLKNVGVESVIVSTLVHKHLSS